MARVRRRVAGGPCAPRPNGRNRWRRSFLSAGGAPCRRSGHEELFHSRNTILRSLRFRRPSRRPDRISRGSFRDTVVGIAPVAHDLGGGDAPLRAPSLATITTRSTAVGITLTRFGRRRSSEGGRLLVDRWPSEAVLSRASTRRAERFPRTREDERGRSTRANGHAEDAARRRRVNERPPDASILDEDHGLPLWFAV